MSGIGSISISRNPVLTQSPHIERTLLPDQGWRAGTYRHETRAQGGFWSASFEMLGPLDALRDFLQKGLAAHVQSFTPAGELAWEGYVHEMDLALPGGLSLSVSLDLLANKVWTRYNTTSDVEVGSTVQDYDPEALARALLFGAGGAVRSAVAEDAASQARWGIREKVLSGGRLASSGVADDIAALYLARFANPTRPSLRIQAGVNQDDIGLTVTCHGYWRTLEWRTYKQTAATLTEDVSAQIDLVVTAAGQFVAESRVAANTLQVPQVHDADRRAADILLDAARLGDASNNRYAIGVYENRILHYEQAPTALAYSLQALAERKAIRALGQAEIPLPLVRPNRWLLAEGVYPYDVTDYATLDENPAAAYIEAVVYQEPGQLQIVSERNRLIDQLLARAALSNTGVA